MDFCGDYGCVVLNFFIQVYFLNSIVLENHSGYTETLRTMKELLEQEYDSNLWSSSSFYEKYLEVSYTLILTNSTPQGINSFMPSFLPNELSFSSTNPIASFE